MSAKHCLWANGSCESGHSGQGGQVIDADCWYEDGVFHLYHVADGGGELCTARFIAPAAYSAGETFRVGGTVLEPRVVNSEDAGGFGFRAGDLVHVGIDMVRKHVSMNPVGASKEYVDAALGEYGATCFNCVGSYSAGVFTMSPLLSLPDPLPALFSLRFKAPAAFAAGGVLRLGGMDYPFRNQDNAALEADAFAAGAVVEVQVGEGCAFFRQGGGAAVDPGTGWNIFPGQSPNPDSAPGLYVPEATMPGAIEIDHMLKTSGSTVRQVACGYYYTVFVLADGTVWNCGRNDKGQLGRPAATGTWDKTNLDRLDGISDVSAVACGEMHATFLKSDGTVWNCGDNTYGQLGRSTASGSPTASNFGRLAAISGVREVAGRGNHTVFLKTDGTVWTCGRNHFGQLGRAVADGSPSSVNLAQLTTGGKTVVSGLYHGVLVKTDGTVWNWGHNYCGQLGRNVASGTATWSNFGQFTTLTGVASIVCGDSHTVFVRTDGTVWNCGYNAYGELGRAVVTGSATATNLGQWPAASGARAIFCGAWQTVLVKTDGSVWTCGWNLNGQQGHAVAGGEQTVNLTRVDAMTGLASHAGGHSQAVFIKRDGTVWSCGNNTSGELGRMVATGGMDNVNTGPIEQFDPPAEPPYPDTLLFIALGQPGTESAVLYNGTVRATIPVQAVYQIRGGQPVQLPFEIR